MRGCLRLLVLACLLVIPPLGCGGSGEDEVLEYDPGVSEEKAKAYEQEMRDAMKNQGRPTGK